MTYSPNKSIRKGFAILECLNQTVGGLPATEVSRRVKIPTATTHRLLKELTDLGYVRWDGKRLTYSIGFRLTLFGNRRQTIERIVRRSRPVLHQLSRQSGMTAYLGSLEGQRVLIEDRAVHDEHGPSHSIGSYIDAHAHSLGKALLALVPESTLLATYQSVSLEAHTPQTMRSIRSLVRALKEVAAAGYAVDNEELSEGTSSVAVPLLNPKGRALCAISLTGPGPRIEPERLANMTVLLKDAAATIMQDIKPPAEFRP